MWRPLRTAKLLLLAAAGVAIGGSLPARGDDMAESSSSSRMTADDLANLSLEQLLNEPVVEAAGRRLQTQREAAASVSVVDANEIDLFGYRNLADVLRNQRSFYLNTDGLNWFAGVRGFVRPGEWNARMLVLVDGRPTRENIYGQTHLDQDFIVPIEAVKQVEIIRGPGSALYGNNAVFGVVNLVTLNGEDLRGGMVRVQGGTQGTARVSVMYGTRTEDGWDLIGGGAGYTSRGDQDILYDGVNDAASNFGHIRDADDQSAAAGFFKVHKGDFTASFDLENREQDNRSAAYLASFFDPGSMHEDRQNAMIRFDHEIERGQSIHAMAYYGRYKYYQDIGYSADPSTHTPAYVYGTESMDDWLGEEIHYDWQASERLHLLVGADATQSLSARQHDWDDLNGQLLDIANSYNAWGIFTEAEYRAADWLTLVAGGRLDYVQQTGMQLSPRAAVILNPTKADTIKLLYGRAFRAPNLYEIYYEVPETNTANPDLRPEIADTYEAVWERQFADGWRTSLDAYYWHMSDALGSVALADESAQVQNIGALSARGVEAEVGRRWDSGANLRIYGTYQRAENEDGEHLPISPEWIAGAAVAVPVLNKRTFLAIDSQIVGPMTSDLGDQTQATYITNVIFTSRDFLGVRNLGFQIGVYNLSGNDARLPHSDAFTHSQRTLNWPETHVMAGLTYRF